MSDQLMTIREMCDAFEVTPRTLRFYEQKELLSPLRQGNRRLYGRRDRARLKLILRGKRFGVSLEDIRQLLDLYQPGDSVGQIKASYTVAKARLAEMEEQRAALDEAITDLRDQMRWAENAISADDTTRTAAA